MKNLLEQIWLKIRMWIADDEVFYIGGAEVLPPPLAVEQEKKCLIALSGVSDAAEEQAEKVDFSREDAKKMLRFLLEADEENA